MAGDPFAGIPAFVAVAEAGGFRPAGERLGVSAAAVSKAVARLEDELGVRLFDRTTRRVELTDEGRLYLGSCQAALRHVLTGRERLELARTTAEGELSIALPYILGPQVVRLVPEFQRRYPSLRVQLSFSDRIKSLVDEQIDVALRIGTLDSSTAIARLLHRTRWVCVASRSYLDERGEPDHPSELVDHDCITYRSPRGYNVPFSFLEEPGGDKTHTPELEPRLIVDQGQMMVDAALAGAGIALVFDFMVQEDLREGRLLPILERFAPSGPPLHALCKPGQQDAPKVRAFLDFMVEKTRGPRPFLSNAR